MQHFRAFSTPSDGNFVSLASQLSSLHLKLLCGRLEKLAATFGDVDAGAVRAIRVAVETTEPSIHCFSPEIGLVYQAAIEGAVTRQSWHGFCAQLAVGAFLSGVLPALDVDVDSHIPLYAAGCRIEPQHLTINGAAGECSFSSFDGHVLLRVTARTQQGLPVVWVADQGSGRPISLGSTSQALLARQHSAWVLEGRLDHSPCDVIDDASAQLSQALATLERLMPEYYLWVVLVLRHITPIVRTGPSTIGSASNFYLPGIVQIACPASVGETIEMLVHECSHQYFNLAMRFGLVEAPDAPQSFSPLTRSNRPLNRILTGYHAFGNVQLVFRRLLELDRSLVSPSRWETVDNGMVELSAILARDSQRYLTDLGRSLYEPLRARLAAA